MTNGVHLIISDFTFEHIRDPSHTANELNRILIPGGWMGATPNKYGYVALSNSCPNSIACMSCVYSSRGEKSRMYSGRFIA
jgi:ubiquinone/menaquinone biosynthesis C-methylase UbiE